jgi:dienelactone hydrolase
MHHFFELLRVSAEILSRRVVFLGSIASLSTASLLANAAVALEPAMRPTNTQPLTLTNDPAAVLVDGTDRFLLKEITATRSKRQQRWIQQTAYKATRSDFIEDRRRQLVELLGIREPRVPFDALEYVSSTRASATVGQSDSVRVSRVRWPVLSDPAGTRDIVSFYGEGLLLQPAGVPFANVIAIPDADQTPEQLCGLIAGIPDASQFARRLAEAGCLVVVPSITSRHSEARNGRSVMTDREFIYRTSFVLGQHLIGYEVDKILAVVDAVQSGSSVPTGVIGYGEGGMLALFAGAIDPRIQTAAVSGYFGPREESWREPLDRNVFGLLNDFGSAQLAAMVAPRSLIVETTNFPDFQFAGPGGAPAILITPPDSSVQQEIEDARKLGARIHLIDPNNDDMGCSETLNSFLTSLAGKVVNIPETSAPASWSSIAVDNETFVKQRRERQLQELDRHNQGVLRESPFVRKEFLSSLETSTLSAYEKSVERYRTIFRKDIVGEFDRPLLPPDAKSRLLETTDHWTAWEIWLDVFQDVGAYGILLLPRDLKPNERRPVVVCQHGLEGRPLDTIQGDHRAYHNYAAKLCEQGFITFAPQNIYIFEDRFRTLQRKANPIGKTLFSVMVPQHQQIVNWLKSQPYVDGDRVAFYGLSYGGKSAMRIPALVTDYCLSICSADFNEWVLKNASTRHDFSYAWTGEYEIFEWNLGRTFNYFEMAALICPRPFMVERGHFDGVGEDDWVGYEYGKVRHLYAAQLKIPERTAIEWFDGPHTINGKGTFDFLHRHLK